MNDSLPTGGGRQRHEEIYRRIRRRIALLDHPPGDRLSEGALAEEFGVSRTPVRRVLARLEGEGLLSSVHGVGTIVSDFDLTSLAQIYALRMELALLIGRLELAPERARALALERFAEVERRCAELADAPDIRTFAGTNIDFFETLMTLTGNRPLREVNRRLYYQTARIWISALREADLPEELAIFRREAADVTAAVRLGDLEAVGHIRRSHISMSFRRLRATTAPGGPAAAGPRK